MTVTDRVEEMCMGAWPVLMIGGKACVGLEGRPVLSLGRGGALGGRNITEMWPIPGMGAGYGSEQVGLRRGGARLQAGGLDSPLGAELIQGVELALGAGPE